MGQLGDHEDLRNNWDINARDMTVMLGFTVNLGSQLCESVKKQLAVPGRGAQKRRRHCSNPVVVPSGELTICYWKWPFIVDFPIKNGDFPLLC